MPGAGISRGRVQSAMCGGAIGEIMTNTRWQKIAVWEDAYKAKSLRRMSRTESFKIFLDLYEFHMSLPMNTSYSRIDDEKINALARMHRLRMKARV
ncbi:MAG: hypothetical protein NC924_08695 [Candidatus Omnitrophica bacterium]|nr:hypothetical protein [Candidatus Omnitrophota bacterium]